MSLVGGMGNAERVNMRWRTGVGEDAEEGGTHAW